MGFVPLGSGRLFNGTRVEAGARLSKVVLGRHLKAVALKLGIPREWVPYDLRHRRITEWAKLSIAIAQVAAGHSDVRMTQWYTHLKRERTALRTLVNDDGAPALPARARHINVDREVRT